MNTFSQHLSILVDYYNDKKRGTSSFNDLSKEDKLELSALYLSSRSILEQEEIILEALSVGRSETDGFKFCDLISSAFKSNMQANLLSISHHVLSHVYKYVEHSLIAAYDEEVERVLEQESTDALSYRHARINYFSNSDYI